MSNDTFPSAFATHIRRLASCGSKMAERVLVDLGPFVPSHLDHVHLLAEVGNPVLARRLPRLMAQLQDSRSVDVLLRLLRSRHEERVIEHALKALSVFKRPDIAEHVRQFSCSSNSQIRMQAIRVLIVQGAADEHFLRHFLLDPHGDIRRAAVLALGQEGSPQAALRCLDLISDRNENVRLAVCRIAARAGPAGIKIIRASLAGDPSISVRRQALKALISAEPEEATGEITTLLMDPATSHFLAATALEELLVRAKNGQLEQLIAFSRTHPGESVQRVIQEWLSNREGRDQSGPACL